MPMCCLECNKFFSTQSNLNRHLLEKHEVENTNIKSYDKDVHNFKCGECNSSFINNNDLRQHLNVKHNLNNNLVELLTFSSYEEFLIWLKHEESDKAIEYVKASTCNNNKFKTIYFNCNRSGKIIEKKVKSKITKKRGSCKLNKYCTSQIVVQSDIITGSILAKYYYIHYGHNIAIQHIRLPKLTKEMVAERLVSGVTPSRILMDERKHVGAKNKQVQRKDLLTRKDINNIKTAYKTKIHACHRAAAVETNFKIFHNSESETLIKNTKNGKEYKIFKNELKENCCHIKCNFCNICIHSYKCTCSTDFLIKSVICKHIHFFILNSETTSVNKHLLDTQQLNDTDENMGVDNYQNRESFKEGEATSIEIKKQQIKNDTSAIIKSLDNKHFSLEKIETASQHIKIAKEMLYMDENNSTSKFVPLPVVPLKEPDNQNIEKQINFFSIKKKTKADAGYLKKLNEDERVVKKGLFHDHNY